MTHEQRGATTLVRGEGVTVRIGDRLILDGVDIAVDAGRIVTLIGPNGSGKTTLVRAMLGLIRPHGGTIWRRRGLTVGYVPQRVHVERTMPLTVRRLHPAWRTAEARSGGSGAGRGRCAGHCRQLFP